MRNTGDPEIDNQVRMFGENMRARRRQMGLSQIDLASASGLDRAAISFLERAERSPDLRTIVRLAQVLNLTPAEMLHGIGNDGVLPPVPRHPREFDGIEGPFAINLRWARACAGLSQEALAHEGMVDRAAISVFECGHREPNLRTVLKLARTLKVAPSELLGGVE